MGYPSKKLYVIFALTLLSGCQLSLTPPSPSETTKAYLTISNGSGFPLENIRWNGTDFGDIVNAGRKKMEVTAGTSPIAITLNGREWTSKATLSVEEGEEKAFNIHANLPIQLSNKNSTIGKESDHPELKINNQFNHILNDVSFSGQELGDIAIGETVLTRVPYQGTVVSAVFLTHDKKTYKTKEEISIAEDDGIDSYSVAIKAGTIFIDSSGKEWTLAEVFRDVPSAPEFDIPGGTYDSEVVLTISSAAPGVIIYYTTDGSVPSAVNGAAYTDAITIDKTQTVRAVAVKEGLNDSEVVSVDFIITLPASYVDLILSNLSVSPLKVTAKSFTVCNFDITNDGPSALISELLIVDYHLSDNTVFGDGDDVKIGDTSHTVTIPAGSSTSIQLSSQELVNMTRYWPDSVPSGNYYAYAAVRVEDKSPAETNLGDNFIRTALMEYIAAPAELNEPNDSYLTAVTLFDNQPLGDSIHAEGNQDWFRFTLPSGARYSLNLSTSGSNGDTEMFLYGPNSHLNLLDDDDDGGTGYFSLITRSQDDSTLLSAGDYYVKVIEYGNNATISSYFINADWTPHALPSKVITVEDSVSSHTEPVSITETKQEVTYQIWFTGSGFKKIYTTGNIDTTGTLRNGDGDVLVTDDDTGDSSNFSLGWNCQAGTAYFLTIETYLNEMGEFDLTIEN